MKIIIVAVLIGLALNVYSQSEIDNAETFFTEITSSFSEFELTNGDIISIEHTEGLFFYLKNAIWFSLSILFLIIIGWHTKFNLKK